MQIDPMFLKILDKNVRFTKLLTPKKLCLERMWFSSYDDFVILGGCAIPQKFWPPGKTSKC